MPLVYSQALSTSQAANSLVANGWDMFSGQAMESLSDARRFVQLLTEFKPDYLARFFPPPIDTYFQPDNTSFNFELPDRPDDPDLEWSNKLPQISELPKFGNLGTTDLETIPLFSKDSPTIQIPDRPSEIQGFDRQAPEILDLQIPEAPSVSLPIIPSLDSISIPSPPSITLGSFAGTRPSPKSLKEPNDTFAFTVNPYDSELFAELIAKVRWMLEGGTGIPTAIEQAIFERARSREEVTALRAIQEAEEQWGARGFTLPGGVLNDQIDGIRQNNQSLQAGLSRDVQIKAQEQEIENLRFAVQQGIALEGLNLQIYIEGTRIAFEVAKFSQESSIALFNARIELFNALVRMYQTDAEVYKEQIQAELLRLQAYRDQLEGLRVKGELNKQRVELYNAQVQGVSVLVGVYREQVAAASAFVDAQRNRMEAYRSEVQAYGELVRAKTAEFEAWETGIKGEMAKSDSFKAESEAYAARVRGIAEFNNAKINEQRFVIDRNKFELDAFLAEVEKSKTDITLEAERIRAGMSVFEGKARMYAAETAARGEEARLHAEDVRLAIEKGRAAADVNLRQFELSINQIQRNAQLYLEALRAAATTSSQLAAGAMSAVNLGASIGSATNYSSQTQESESKDTNENTTHYHYYDHGKVGI